jgi:hypothetical protein
MGLVSAGLGVASLAAVARTLPILFFVRVLVTRISVCPLPILLSAGVVPLVGTEILGCLGMTLGVHRFRALAGWLSVGQATE